MYAVYDIYEEIAEVTSRPVTLRMPEEVRSAIEESARRSRRGFSSVANEMLTEAVRMRRIPGILFADSASGGRVARIAGTGLEVWEVIQGFQNMGEDWDRFKEGYHWLSEHQLRAALAYYEAFPGEIDERITENESWTPERLQAEYPLLSPTGR